LPLVKNWLTETLMLCPTDIQCLETEAVKWLQVELPGLVVAQQTPLERSTLALSEPLKTLIPAAGEPDALVQRLCELWNTGKAQKKLGECTPQAFLEALRR
jgi:hypothetical protein